MVSSIVIVCMTEMLVGEVFDRVFACVLGVAMISIDGVGEGGFRLRLFRVPPVAGAIENLFLVGDIERFGMAGDLLITFA